MSRYEKLIRTLVTGMTLLALATAASAAPIRVGIFKSYGQGRFWHTNIHTAGAAIASILENPDSANLGPDLVKPKDGFIVTQYGRLSGSGTTTDEEEAPFFDALDSLDVVVFPSIVDMGNVIEASHPTKRSRLLQHIRTKGVVSIHATTDSYGTWPAWDSVHGTRFQNIPSSDRMGTLHLDSAGHLDDNGRFLNRGLPDTARFVEEWFSFTTNGDVIRATGVKVTVRIDEKSYGDSASGQWRLGGARIMGDDHPLSWYRAFPEGGRFFYTALGHRPQHYTGTGSDASPATHFLRRQLYNAILWAAGVDSTGAVVSLNRNAQTSPARFPETARLSLQGNALRLTLKHNEPHTIVLTNVQGKVVDTRRGAGREHVFANLRPGLHLVSITTPAGRTTRRVVMP